MSSSNRWFGLVAALAAITVAVVIGANATAQGSVESKSTLVLNVISGKEDLHAVTMAYQLAGHGLDAGRHVVLFLNVRAPELATKGLPAKLSFAKNPPLRQMLADLMTRGAQVLVCPACLEATGFTAADLVEGAQPATRDTLFGNLGSDAVVFTY